MKYNMTKYCQKCIVSLLIGCQVFYFISPLIVLAQATSTPSSDDLPSSVTPSDPKGNFLSTPLDEGLKDPVSTLPFATGPSNSNGSSLTNPSPTAAKQFPSQRVVLNSTDRRKLQQTAVLYGALPDFHDESNLHELAAISGVDYNQIIDYRLNNPTQFNSIVASAIQRVNNDDYLLKRVSKDPVILAKLYNVSKDYMASEIASHPQDVLTAVQQTMSTQVDQRVIKTLEYLVTPKDQGGAGHWQIKVERITQNHDKEFNKYENEDLAIKNQQKQADNSSLQNTTIEQMKADQNTTAAQTTTKLDSNSQAIADVVDQSGKVAATAFIGNGIDEDQNTISAHFTGQAVDISTIDDIKCTTIGKTWLGPDQKTAQAPQPIKLQWQTPDGYNSDKKQIDSSFNNMFMNASQSSINSMLSQLNFNFGSLSNLNGASFSDMTSLVAQAFILNTIGAPTDANVWKFNLGDTLRSLGGVMVADKLGLNRGAFLDPNINSIDALAEGIGRSIIEQKLKLPYGSLKGQNRNDLLASVGKARILSELNLPSDILNFTVKDDNDLYQRIGSREIESTFGLTAGSFYGKGNLDEVNKSAGTYKTSALSSLSSGVDQQLNLTNGTYQRFLSGAISPSDLNRLVAEAHFTTFVANYKNYEHSPASDNVPTVDLPSGKVSNLRDDMFNLPKGTIDKFLNGDLSNDDLANTGKYSIANSLDTNDVGRSRLTAWLNSPNESLTVPVTTTDSSGAAKTDATSISYVNYAATMGVSDKDLYRMFGQDNAQAVFKRIGEQSLSQGLKQTDSTSLDEQSFINSLGQVETISQPLDFYQARITSISGLNSNYQNHVKDLTNQLAATPSEQINEQIKQEILTSMAKLSAAIASAGNANTAASITAMGKQIFDITNQQYQTLTKIAQAIGGNTGSSVANLTHAINAVQYDTESIAKSAYEINTGQVQSDFRFGDLTIGNMQSLNLTFGNGSFSNSDFASLFAGKIALKEFMVSAGSAQMAGSFNLPTWSLKYAASTVDNFANDSGANAKDAFFRAMGVSALESNAKLNSGTLAASNSLGKNISINDFRQIVKNKQNSTQTSADAMIAESLNLAGYNLQSLMTGDFAAWSTARAKANDFDTQNGLSFGTTEKFIKGSALGDFSNSSISSDELRQTATAMHISESSIETFVAAMNGQKDPAINKIYYVDNNRYATPSAASSASSCAQPQIPDGSFVYYDQDGLHTFNSNSTANEYRKAHADRELNYLDEISNSLGFAISRSAGTDNPAQGTATTLQKDLNGKIKSSLESFINGNQTKPFDDATFARLSSLMQTNFNLPTTVFDRAFSRSNSSGTIDSSAQMDYLKVLGYSVVNSGATVQLNDSLGTNFGSSKISPDDLYDMMNGNGQATFSRVGGTLLEQEMDLSTGTVQSVLNSGTDDQRQCNMQNASLNLIGNKIGSPDMKLSGSLLDSFGGRRIENNLGLPSASFKGTDLNSLLSSVPVEDLAQSFNIPYTKGMEDAANAELQKMGNDSYANNINKSFYNKLGIIESNVYGLGKDAPTVKNTGLADGLSAIKSQLSNVISTVLPDSKLYSSDINVAVSALKSKGTFSGIPDNDAKILLGAFLSKVGAADGTFGLGSGSTAKLLSGTLSPDNFRSQVNATTLTDTAGNYLISSLGLDGTGITTDRFSQFITAIRNLGSGDINTASAGNRTTVYKFLSDMFSINLDSKAGFKDGTFAQIIAKPWQATTILLNEGIRKIDASLGRTDQPLSLQNILNLYLNTSPTDQTACDNPSVKSYSSCINDARRSLTGRITDLAIQQASSAASELISSWITDITNVKVSVTGKDISAYGITIPVNDLLGIFHGDYRTLLLTASIQGAASIIGDKVGRLAVGPGFVLNYQDFYSAIFGNPGLEDYARTRATNSALAAANGSPISNDNSGGTLVSVTPATNTTANALIPTPPASVNDATRADIDNAYPLPAGANTTPPAYPGDIPVQPGTEGKTPQQIFQEQQNYFTQMMDFSNRAQRFADVMQTASVAGGQAASQVKTSFTSNLEYKAIDCMLYKLDKDIPAGFAKLMMTGDTKNMVGGVAAYMVNKFLNDSSIGKDIPPAIRSALISYLSGNINSGQFVSTVEGAGVDFIDNWLANNSPSVFGVNLFQPGTFKGIVALIQSGNFNTDAILSGIVFPALNKKFGTTNFASLIGNWVDNQVGLPHGVTMAIYTYFTNKNANWRDLASMLIPEKYAKYAGYLEKANKYYNLYKSGGASAVLGEAASEYLDPVSYVFGKVGGWLDEKFGLPPGTLQHLFKFLYKRDPVELILFFTTLLFGVHRIDVVCTADGYYPDLENKPDPTKWDVANLGNFNGKDAQMRQQGYIKAAQYKAGQLVFDVLAAKDRTGNPELVPTQIMTARVEDVGPNATLVENTICNKVGSGSLQDNTAICSGWRSRSGLWANPQTVAWTHIGF